MRPKARGISTCFLRLSLPASRMWEDAQLKPLPSDIEAILYGWCENGEFYQNGSFVDWCIESDFFGTRFCPACGTQVKDPQ